MKFATLIAAPVVLATSLAAINVASAETGIYSGISGNNTNFNGGGDFKHHNKQGGGAFVGFKYAPWLSTELSYDDYGNRVRTTGLSVVPELPVGAGFSVFARGGFNYVDASGKGARNWAPSYGAGVKYQLPFEEWPVFARLEYDRVPVNSDFKIDSTKASIGVQF